MDWNMMKLDDIHSKGLKDSEGEMVIPCGILDGENLEGPLLKVVSWNINGMRTIDMPETLKKLKATVLAVQETKLSRHPLNLDRAQVIPERYSSYFSFSSNKQGYSGVATFCRDDWAPVKAEQGLTNMCPPTGDEVKGYPDYTLDEEADVQLANKDGRLMLTTSNVMLPNGSTKPLTIINVYCPRLRDDPEEEGNADFKRVFHKLLHRRALNLVGMGQFVIIAGDMNISHTWMDHCDGKEETFVKTDYRKMLDELLLEKFVDSFRSMNPGTTEYTCWNTRLNARENNYGTRIDYIFVDKGLAPFLASARIHGDVMGSDHCPISVTFHSLKPVCSDKLPSIATGFYPEYRGQRNVKEMFQRQLQPLSQKSADIADADKANNDCKKRRLEETPKTKPVQLSLKSFFTVKTNSTSKSPPLENLEESVAPAEEANPAKKLKTDDDNKSQTEENTNSVEKWKLLMKAPEAPLCAGHKEACVLRTVKKKGANFNRQFWSCAHGVGKPDDPNANCNHFQWAKERKEK